MTVYVEPDRKISEYLELMFVGLLSKKKKNLCDHVIATLLSRTYDITSLNENQIEFRCKNSELLGFFLFFAQLVPLTVQYELFLSVILPRTTPLDFASFISHAPD